MKKILLTALIVLAVFFAVSCAEEDAIANALGKSCAVEGEETCSADSSQILICQDASWQAKKSCNLNFGQYCRQTESGSYSCTDSGNTTEPTDSTDDDITDPTDIEPNDSDPTDQESNDNEPEPTEPTEPEPEDNDPTEPEPEDNDPTEPNDTDSENTDIETCADIFKCQDECPAGDQNCPTDCFYDGSTQAQNDFYAWKNCKTEHNYDYNKIVQDEACKSAMIGCGVIGDMTYDLPYGHAIVQTSIPYLYSYTDRDSSGTLSVAYANSTTTFITGNFGNSGNIVNPASQQGTYTFAELTDTSDIDIIQSYKDDTLFNPMAQMIIDASVDTPGTYTVGLSSSDKVTIIIMDVNGSQISCYHAFGYGSVTISAISHITGTTTISIAESEINLYSFKNAPMYVNDEGGHDISSTTLVACQPK